MNILSALLPQSSQIQMPLTISIAIGISVLPLVLISHMPIVSYLCLSPLCIGLPLEPSNKLYILSFSKLQWFSTVTVKSKLLTKTPHVSLLTLPHNLHEGSFSSHAGFYSVVHIFFFLSQNICNFFCFKGYASRSLLAIFSTFSSLGSQMLPPQRVHPNHLDKATPRLFYPFILSSSQNSVLKLAAMD